VPDDQATLHAKLEQLTEDHLALRVRVERLELLEQHHHNTTPSGFTGGPAY
jgi:hypothetical protein